MKGVSPFLALAAFSAASEKELMKLVPKAFKS